MGNAVLGVGRGTGAIGLRDAIEKIKPYFNGKLLLSLNPPSGERLAVSKAKATHFKEWVGS